MRRISYLPLWSDISRETKWRTESRLSATFTTRVLRYVRYLLYCYRAKLGGMSCSSGSDAFNLLWPLP